MSRIVATVEELNALPTWTVIIQNYGLAAQKLPHETLGTSWVGVGNLSTILPEQVKLPALVVHDGDDTELASLYTGPR